MPLGYLTRRATFCASHRLHISSKSESENKALFGKCNHPHGHGHNYVLEVTVRSEIDPNSGMIMNLKDLKHIIDELILSDVDHKHLNLDVPEFKDKNPTAEMIALVFWKRLEKNLPERFLFEVKIHETENNVAFYRGE